MDNFEKMVSGNSKIQSYFFLAVFLGVAFLSFLILKPFLMPFIFAVVFAVLFKHFYFKILKFFRGRSSFSSLATVFLILLLILTPLTFLGVELFSQAGQAYQSFEHNGSGFIQSVRNFSEQTVVKVADFFNLDTSSLPFSLDFNTYMKQGASWIIGNLGSIFSNFSLLFFNVILFIIMLYYLLKHGVDLKRFLVKFSPLSNQKDIKIIDRFEFAISSIMKGSIMVALIQGSIAGIGFAIFGIPQPVLWGSLAAVSALIPGIGTSLVLIPVIIYSYIFGSTGNTIGLLSWGVLAVGLIDNLLSPWLISHGSKIHPFLIFLSVLGGLFFFGPIGFLLGPLTLSLLVALFDVHFVDAPAS